MKKSKLIELLQSIEGDPEIMIYNGFVQDVMHIKPPQIDELVRMRTTVLKRLLKFEGKEFKGPEEWRFSTMQLEDKNPDMYEKRKIVVLESRKTGKTTFDRMGTIEY